VNSYPELRVDETNSDKFADPMGEMTTFGGGEAR
jgi:hypothetical protein